MGISPPPRRRLRHAALCGAVVLAGLLLAVPAGASTQYSLLNSGSSCTDYVVADVPDSNTCFNTAAPAVGLGSKSTLVLDGVGVVGCVYNTEADIVIFGTSAEQLKLASWQYICDGIPTTTTTTTFTVSTVTTSTFTAASSNIFSLIGFNENCAWYQIPDVSSDTECFSEAAPYVGLSSIPTVQVDGMGFSGCVFNSGSNLVLYGVTAGVSGATSSLYQYICAGLATTTTTTTETSTTTTTITVTSTTTTTITTTTITSTTSTTSTTTISTTTSTTSTETTSTSTATTSTYTGSSSTTTTTTATSSTSTLTSTTTTSVTTTETVTLTTVTTSTETTSTSTMTTQTFTGPDAAGFVGDDPLTLYGDVAKQFYFPDETLVQLLATPELQLLGSASGVGSEQYINHLVVTGPSGEDVLQVRIRSDIAAYEPDEAPADEFATMNVTLDWLNGMPLKAIPPPEAFAYTWGSVVFAFGRLPHFKIGKAPAEVIVVEGTSARIIITSVAKGFEGEDAHSAVKHAHLDFVLHMKQRDTCEGILPELWGLKPLSNETLAMMETPQ